MAQANADPIVSHRCAPRHKRARVVQPLGQAVAMDPGAGGRASANPACVETRWSRPRALNSGIHGPLLPSASAAGPSSRYGQLLISREQDGPVAEGQSQIGIPEKSDHPVSLI